MQLIKRNNFSYLAILITFACFSCKKPSTFSFKKDSKGKIVEIHESFGDFKKVFKFSDNYRSVDIQEISDGQVQKVTSHYGIYIEDTFINPEEAQDKVLLEKPEE